MESVSLIDLSNRVFSLNELEAELEMKGGGGARVNLSRTSMRWNDCVKLVKLLEQSNEIQSKHLRFELLSFFFFFVFFFVFFLFSFYISSPPQYCRSTLRIKQSGLKE
jgi:hypothetical protein